VTNVYGDTDIDRNKHIHKKRKLAEGREKTMVSSLDFLFVKKMAPILEFQQ